MKKTQTQVLITEQVRRAYGALAIVRGEAMAEVTRVALDAQLPALQARHASDLARIAEAAKAMRVTETFLVDHIIGANKYMKGPIRMGLVDLFDSQGNPWRSMLLMDGAFKMRLEAWEKGEKDRAHRKYVARRDAASENR